MGSPPSHYEKPPTMSSSDPSSSDPSSCTSPSAISDDGTAVKAVHDDSQVEGESGEVRAVAVSLEPDEVRRADQEQEGHTGSSSRTIGFTSGG